MMGKKDIVISADNISYISDKAEFTPKIIQTKEERVTLVYAVTLMLIMTALSNRECREKQFFNKSGQMQNSN